MTSSRWTCRWPARVPWAIYSRSLRHCASLAAAAVLVLAGCSDQQADSAFKRIVYRPTPQRAALNALQQEQADARRRSLLRVVTSKHTSSDWAVKTLDVIARTDLDPQVRCTALGGLRRSGRPEAVETALAILNPATTTRPVRTGEDEVRFDAINLLEAYLAAGQVPETLAEPVRTVLLKATADDPLPRARMAAARALRHCPHPDTLAVLVKALDAPDFGLNYEAEMSLRALTGRTGDYEPAHWQEWLAQTQDPFAGREAYAARQREANSLANRTSEFFSEMWDAWQGPAKATGKPGETVARQQEAQRLATEAAE